MKTKIILIVLLQLIPLTILAESPSASSMLRSLDDWINKIDNFSINYSLTYKAPNGKINKVERRKLSFLRTNSRYSHFRYELVHPEKLVYLVTPASYQKHDKKSGKDLEETVLTPSEVLEKLAAEKNHSKTRSFYERKVHQKVKELFKNLEFVGASIPSDFKFRSVYKRAIVLKETVFMNKHCYIIGTKSSQKHGVFWITKDNNNLLKYRITNEDKSQELVVVNKKKKISSELYIPIEVKKVYVNPDGSVKDTIIVKYYGYAVNRKVGMHSFKVQ